MFLKSFSLAAVSAAFVLCLQLSAAAQYAPVSGKVQLLKADGTREPVAGAVIDIYRTDIKTSAPTTKTNKKGEFSIVGMLFGADYVFSVSAPNMSPLIYPN